ncbi:MAG: PAS domain S-box protein [Methanoregula sp.]|jgi:PAS domain S-box-containing protein
MVFLSVTKRFVSPPVILAIVLVSFFMTQVATFLLANFLLAVMGMVLYLPVILVALCYPRLSLPVNLCIACAYLGMAGFIAYPEPVALVTVMMQFLLYICISIVLASVFGESGWGGSGYRDFFEFSSCPACLFDVSQKSIVRVNSRFRNLFCPADRSTLSPAFMEFLSGLLFQNPRGNEGATVSPKKITVETPNGPGVFLAGITTAPGAGRVFVTFSDITVSEQLKAEESTRSVRDEIIGRLISRTWENRETLLCETLDDTLDLMHFDCGGIFLVQDGSGQRVKLECAKNIPSPLLAAVREIRSDDSLIAPVYTSGRVVVIEDVFSTDPGLCQRHGICSLAGIPITHRDTVTGALVVATKEHHRFLPDEISVLEGVGRHLGNAIEHVRISMQLQLERENLQILFNTMDEFVAILEKDGTIIEVNDALIHTFGYAREELLGRSLFDLHGPKKRSEIKTAFFRILVHPTGDSRYCFFTRAKLPVETECRIREGQWDGKPVYFCISRDITGRSHAEKVLTRRTAILEAVSFAADRFLKEPIQGTSWTDEIPAVLEILGQATGSGRICIFENRPCPDNPDIPCTTLRFEWVNPPFTSRLGDPRLIDIRFPEVFPDAYRDLSGGKPVFLRVNELPFLTDESARANGSLELINVPILADSRWWGILTIEPGSGDQEWSRIETDALVTAAGILGSAIHHRSMVEIYQNPVEHSLVGIFLLENGVIRYVNPRFAEMFGYSPGELSGKVFVPLLVAPRDQPLVEKQRLAKESGREKSTHYCFYGVRKDGAIITLENYSTRVDFQGQPGIIGTLMDITERTKAEDALKESEIKFRTLSEASPVGIFLADREGNLAYANDKWFEITGLTRENAAGVGWKSVIPREFQARFEQFCEDSIREAKVVSEEFRILHADGSQTWAFLRALARRDAGGRINGFAGVIVDITERKKYEDALRTAVDEKSVLIMEIHHRVKNNLQIISGLIRLQSRYIINEQALRALKECENRVITMALVHESLYQSGNLANINARRHISTLVHNLILSDELGTRIRIETDIDDMPLDMNIAIPVSLIINELVINSLKYAFTGRDHGTIRVILHKNTDDNLLVLIVSDDGVGVLPGVNILESKSLGIKLVIRLARDQLKGDIEISSKGGGTTVTIRFPDAECGTLPADGVS